MRFGFTLPIAAALCVGACATPSEVTPLGNGLYKVSARGTEASGSAGEQKAIAIRRANDYCNAQSLQMQITDSHMTEAAPAIAPAADVDFRCDKP